MPMILLLSNCDSCSYCLRKQRNVHAYLSSSFVNSPSAALPFQKTVSLTKTLFQINAIWRAYETPTQIIFQQGPTNHRRKKT
ncbi:hypothetical protein TNCV_393291 [Trichonephila clavipes]|nr:hypothetical protein TNCV_393291 [Trichonephila clavipes]